MKEVKVVEIIYTNPSWGEESRRKNYEAKLNELVNDGWVIVGAGSFGWEPITGFVILQRGT